VLAALLTSADAAGVVSWDASVDSTIIRAHQHAANLKRPTEAGSNYKNLRAEPADHALGRSRGGLSTKIHQLVDGHGYPLVVLVGPGQAGDAPMFPHLMTHLSIARPGPGRPRTRPNRVRADKAYSSRAIRGHLRRRDIVAVIPEPADQTCRLVPRRAGSRTSSTTRTVADRNDDPALRRRHHAGVATGIAMRMINVSGLSGSKSWPGGLSCGFQAAGSYGLIQSMRSRGLVRRRMATS
jgi:hypothetical protein